MAIPSYQFSTITFLDLETRTLTTAIDPDNEVVWPTEVAFSPDGETLFVGNAGAATVAIIDTATKRVTGTLELPNGGVSALGVSPDGNYLVVADSLDAVTVYTIEGNAVYTPLGTINPAGTYVNFIYFDSDESAVLVDKDGLIQGLSLVDGRLNTSMNADVSGFHYWCGPSDNSVIAGFTDSVISLVNPLTGDRLQQTSLVAAGASSLAQCTFTNRGTIIVTDHSFGVEGAGHIFILDGTTLELLETISLPGVQFTEAVGVMGNCDAFIAGYSANVAVVTLDSDYCALPASPEPEIPASPGLSEPPAPALATTGVSTGTLGTALAASALAVTLGALALAGARRRENKSRDRRPFRNQDFLL
jgi:YVTN family beta-propeller protein